MEESGGQTQKRLNTWNPMVGIWNTDQATGEAIFENYEDPSFKIGIALSDVGTRRCVLQATVNLEEVSEGCAHFVLGHSSAELRGFTVGLGGFGHAYSISEYWIGRKSTKIVGLALKGNLKSDRNYHMEVQLRGQSVRLMVDGVRVLDHVLPHPLLGDQVGIKGYGDGKVRFSNVSTVLTRPRAFVVMQFTEPYNSFWSEVVKPVAERAGYEAYRADAVFRPGIVLHDIVSGIVTSDVIIAEVSPRNPNVFYELGYAHAIGKPTILLAEQPAENKTPLPFDISGFRCIFYENAIRGKSDVEQALEKHLRNIRQEEWVAV